MVITDIKNTKIRAESDYHSEEIQKAALKLGCYWFDGDSRIGHYNFIFFDRDLLMSQSGNSDLFENNSVEKEIFFYNGEFHNKPQDDDLMQFCGERFDDMKDAAVSKLLEIGYEFHGEWLSKEEIAAKERECELHEIAEFMKQDKSPSDCEAIYNYITYKGYRKGEL